jgi:OmpA-OmpF porin, OOP family
MAASRLAFRCLLFALTALFCGCAAYERIVLLPEAAGGPTSLVVRQGEREVLLDRPYAAAELTIADPFRYEATPAEVRATFGEALSAQPARAAHFTLYFVEGSDDLTEESKETLERVFADIAKRGVRDIVVVGHTDAVGSDQYNDALAKKRADAVSALLVGRGVAASDIVAIGRGKRDLLIATPSGIAEPRNRRVEVVVR